MNLSLFNKLLIAVLVAAILPVLTLLYFLFGDFKSVLDSQQEKHTNSQNQLIARLITHNAESRLDFVEHLSKSPVFMLLIENQTSFQPGNVISSLRAELEKIRQQSSNPHSADYEHIYLIRNDGEVLFSSDPKYPSGIWLESSGNENSLDALFKTVQENDKPQGMFWTGEPGFISLVFFHSAGDNRFPGAYLLLTGSAASMLDIDHALSGTGIDDYEWVLLDHEHHQPILARGQYPELQLTLSNESYWSSIDVSKADQELSPVNAGDNVWTAYKSLMPYLNLDVVFFQKKSPDTDIGWFISQKTPELLASLLVTLSIGLMLFSFSFNKHLKGMYEHLQKIANGDFRQRLEIKRRDELGRLGILVNQVIDKLAESRRSLKEDVEQKNRLIHDLAESEKKVRTSNAQLSGILETAVDGIIIIDQEGKILEFNNAAERIFEYRKSELLGKNISLLVPMDHASKHNTYLKKHLQGHYRDTVVGRRRSLNGLRKSGQVFPLSLSVSEWVHENGRYYTGIVTDMTEYELMASTLRTSQERFVISQDFANMGTWEWNVDTGEMFWSEGIYKLLGLQPDTESSYENFLLNVHGADIKKLKKAFTDCLNQQLQVDLDYRVILSDSSEHWLRIRGDMPRDENRESDRILGVLMDIHEIKIAERALREREELFRSITSHSPAAIFLTDEEGYIRYVNDTMCEMLGQDASEITSRTIEYFVHDADKAPFFHSWQKLHQQESVETLEYRMQTPQSSEEIWVNSIIAPLDDDAHLRGYLGINTDISFRKKFESQMLQAKLDAEHANAAKSQFLSRMSHELRTPMNSILGFAQLLSNNKQQPLSEKQALYVEQISKGGKHLLELINDVLDLSRIESGVSRLDVKAYDLKEIMDDCLDFASTIASKYAIELKRDYTLETGELIAMLDYTRAKQVILNLLSNAIKYNRLDGQVIVRIRSDELRARIEVEDTGPGIPDNKKSLVFEPFNRLDAEKTNIEGTGIGLTLSREIAREMFGELGFESEFGKGSVFWFEFPLKIYDENEESVTDVPTGVDERPADFVHGHRSCRILYVEDNDANRRLMESVISEIPSYVLKTVPDSDSALTLIPDFKPELLILDINLGDENGIDLLQEIRQLPETRNTPALALSADAMDISIQKALSSGFVQYFTKPLDVDELVNTIENMGN